MIEKDVDGRERSDGPTHAVTDVAQHTSNTDYRCSIHGYRTLSLDLSTNLTVDSLNYLCTVHSIGTICTQYLTYLLW